MDLEAARKFLTFMEENSFGFVEHEWASLTTDEIHSHALELYERIENEVNVLNYLRQTKYALH